MKEFVGVKPQLAVSAGSLKRELLIFTRIALSHYASSLKRLREEPMESSQYLANELEWLVDNKIIFDPGYAGAEIELENEEHSEILTIIRNSQKDVTRNINEIILRMTRAVVEGKKGIELKNYLDTRLDFVKKSIPLADEYIARLVSIQLRLLDSMDAYPILSSLPHVPNASVQKTDIVRIVLDTLPIPDDSVSWEQIHEYLADPDTKSKFLGLRNWMNETVRGGSSPIEVEERLEYLIDKYQQHLNLHKMKSRTGTIETIVVTGAEFLEELVKFKWGKIAKGLFSFKHERVSLMEGELTLPGNEIAFIVAARDNFSPKSRF